MTDLKILLVEDSAQDLALIERQFKKAELNAKLVRVDTVSALKTELTRDWNLVVSDYHLPGFNALDVIALVQADKRDLPVIVMSGALGEEAAVEIIKAGAKDFLLKENLHRLPIVVDREVREAANRSSRLKNEVALAESESKFKLLADSIPQLAWMAEPDGHIFWYNKQWYDYTGTTFEEMQGWGWEKVHKPENLPSMLSIWKKALATGEAWNDTFQLKSKAGEYRWFLSRALPMKNAQSKITGWFGTNTDIQGQKDVEEQLYLAKEEAEKANRLKSAFLANMSHEIRTPLGVLTGFADLISDPDISAEERRQYAATLKRNGEQLTALVNDILDLSKVEAGHLEVEALPFNFLPVIEEVVSSFKLKAKEKGLELRIENPGQLIKLTSDAIRLKQILWNLIGNAIKFTHHGSVTILTAEVNGTVVLDVADTGIGISKADQKKLFKPFSQADESMTRKFGGTGLGLALSKRLSELLGGTLELKDSEFGSGSTFRLVIKSHLTEVKHGEQTPQLHSHVKLPGNALTATVDLDNLKILVVDDSQDNQHLIWRLLTKRGATVDLANNGSEAIQRASRGGYDLIIMDIQMPVMDGYTATQQLRDLGLTVPIIALTAHAMSEIRQKCLDVGCTDWAPKPINAADLLGKVLQHTAPRT